MNTVPGEVITEETKKLCEKLIASPDSTQKEAIDLYTKELDFLRAKYNVKSNFALIELADSEQVDLSDIEKILDYTSFLEFHQ